MLGDYTLGPRGRHRARAVHGLPVARRPRRVLCAERQPSSVASSVISSTPASARETMQPSFAALAVFWNASSSRPGTRARVVSATLVIVGQALDVAQRHLGLRLDRLRLVAALAERERERHREAAGVGRREQLLGVGAVVALLEARLERVVALEGAGAERHLAAALLQRAFPERVGGAGCHRVLLSVGWGVSSLAIMSRNQRLSFLGIAAVIAVVAIVVLTTGGSDDTSTDDSANTSAQQTATPSATPTAAESDDETPTPTPTPTAKPKPQAAAAGGRQGRQAALQGGRDGALPGPQRRRPRRSTSTATTS